VPLTAIELGAESGLSGQQHQRQHPYTLFFGDRGAGDFNGYGLLDLAATYRSRSGRSRPWIKVEFYNLLNNDKLIGGHDG